MFSKISKIIGPKRLADYEAVEAALVAGGYSTYGGGLGSIVAGLIGHNDYLAAERRALQAELARLKNPPRDAKGHFVKADGAQNANRP